jgi:hypothetical protein
LANPVKASATSSTIITGEPDDFVRQSPPDWLSCEDGEETSVPSLAKRMKGVADQWSCNSPKNDDTEIIVPVEPQFVSQPENQPQLQLLSWLAQIGTKAVFIFLVLVLA